MNMGKQHQLFPHTLIICPSMGFERVDNSIVLLYRCWMPPPYNRRKRFRRSRSNFVVAAKRLRDLRAANAGLPFDQRTSVEPGRASTPNLGADLSKHIFSCLGNKSSAREPPFGVQACIRKDKPEGLGAASRPKGGSRARCARGSERQLSSPVRAEHVLSFTKPLQRLVCRGLSTPSVDLQTDSVCRGRARKRRPIGASKRRVRLT
jgi:hypothetical protein